MIHQTGPEESKLHKDLAEHHHKVGDIHIKLAKIKLNDGGRENSHGDKETKAKLARSAEKNLFNNKYSK